MSDRTRRIEFGDFQTPPRLACDVCGLLVELGLQPDTVIEPTCGVGAFVLAALDAFPAARSVFGFDCNGRHLDELRGRLHACGGAHRVHLEEADFFGTDWRSTLASMAGSLLILGNLPWVTNAAMGAIGGGNLPAKSNFMNRSGFDAIGGKSNFDISEWMLLEILRWFNGRPGDIAMLVKTAVARKVLAYARAQSIPVQSASLFAVDAKREFGAAVDACLMVVRLTDDPLRVEYDYTVFESLSAPTGHRVGHRSGFAVGDMAAFESHAFLLGHSPQKWRSGIKHDASHVMEFRRTDAGLANGSGELVDLEETYLFPMMKGSDIGSGREWRGMYMLVPQRQVGEPTEPIRDCAPRTWAYLENHAGTLDARRSIIYLKNPRYSIFGVGEYAFRPWRIAICSLYKTLSFRLQPPVEGRPVMFDDTVYYLSFDDEAEARNTLARLQSEPAQRLLRSLIFWDEKRPIKTGILNVLDWSLLDDAGGIPSRPQPAANVVARTGVRSGARP
ncbi:MAG TPA: SAM-dependent methyltransferase [Candidatus Kapabacteria bacterium]|nr:SAM-dependent methyltransferase [Candidatus Kapabacteria bacterium]